MHGLTMHVTDADFWCDLQYVASCVHTCAQSAVMCSDMLCVPLCCSVLCCACSSAPPSKCCLGTWAGFLLGNQLGSTSVHKHQQSGLDVFARASSDLLLHYSVLLGMYFVRVNAGTAAAAKCRCLCCSLGVPCCWCCEMGPLRQQPCLWWRCWAAQIGKYGVLLTVIVLECKAVELCGPASSCWMWGAPLSASLLCHLSIQALPLEGQLGGSCTAQHNNCHYSLRL